VADHYRADGSTAAATEAEPTLVTEVAAPAAVGATARDDDAPAGDGEDPIVSDTSYSDDTLSISISQIQTGSGDDTITYYVADVRPAAGVVLRAGLAGGRDGTADTSDIAAANDAILAINGDYFGARDDGIIVRNGEICRDEGVRPGLALYLDGRMEVYDETETTAEELLDAGVWNTYSFGPALVVDGGIPQGIEYYEVEDDPEHPIQGRDPRTAIGIIGENHYLFVVVDGRDAGYSKGVTVEELAQIMLDLGCDTAYNLDGGGSSTMWFMGELVNDPSGKSGERDISDILFAG
ncbi:MAG: phosphodiester glycosidase family protein, partial [Thermoleophilia bacterium]|nr:phosphodiester glycosidase family protein [Thermoleophilia bacterium]